MEFLIGHKGREAQIIDLFTSTFTASEGEEEGALIGELVRNLLGGTAPEDRFVFTAEEEGVILGGIVFSRLRYDKTTGPCSFLPPSPWHPCSRARASGSGC